MNRKGFITVIAALVLTFAMATTSFAFSLFKTDTDDTQGYSFTTGTVKIVLNEDASEVLKSLGNAEKVFEQDSCAYQGKDRVYSYKDFELSTYPVNNKEYVSSIYFLTADAVTEEGIHFGSTYQDMVNAYGTGYTESFQVYRYEKNGTELAFYMTNNVIDGIEYLIVTQ